MITIIPSGRLGNQLFQFAFGLAISKKLHTDFIFNATEIEEFFELPHYNNPIIKQIRMLRYKFSLKFNRYTSLDLNKDIKPEEIISLVSNNKVLYGYFQSPQFFSGYEHLIKKEFKIKKEHSQRYSANYSQLFNKRVVCIAVRISDYLTWHIDEIDGNTPELDLNYFKKSLDLVPDLEAKNIIIISEEIEKVKKYLNIENAIYIAPAIDQFISLMRADHLIISNSTFQWWGAWLNDKPGKVVYAPKYWLGHKVRREYPQNIIPLGWVQEEA
jgi:hypothetical protein